MLLAVHARLERIAATSDVSWHYCLRRDETFSFEWHFHPEFELTLITRGSGMRIVGDSVENYHVGDLTLIGGEVPHTYVSAPGFSDNEAIVLQFRRDFLGAEFLAHPECTALAHLLNRANSGLSFGEGTLSAESLSSLCTGRPLKRTLGLLRLLDQLAHDDSARTLTTRQTGQRLNGMARMRAQTICSYLQTVFTEPVRLSDVAAVVHMTPSSCSRFFRRVLGRSITDYVTELRIAAACQLLVDTDLPIAEVAIRSGYENLSNFNRRFRAVKGLSPRQFRKVASGHVSPVTSGIPQTGAP